MRAQLGPEKQILQVLQAYTSGCRTTLEVSELTGLSIKHCASYSTSLVDAGMLAIVGMAPRRFKKGRRRYWYEPVGGE